MGVTSSNKVISTDRIACDGSLRVTLALTAAPDILTMITEAGSGHPGGSLSCTDILTALYFGGVSSSTYLIPKPPPRFSSVSVTPVSFRISSWVL